MKNYILISTFLLTAFIGCEKALPKPISQETRGASEALRSERAAEISAKRAEEAASRSEKILTDVRFALEEIRLLEKKATVREKVKPRKIIRVTPAVEAKTEAPVVPTVGKPGTVPMPSTTKYPEYSPSDAPLPAAAK
jgi:hypothetical protein